MNSKILLLSVAVIAVGLFAMPQTLSLFAGQHTFVTGENVSCAKCHQDIVDEMTSSGNTAHTDANMTNLCQECHATAGWGDSGINVTYNQWRRYSSDTLVGTINVTAHAAVTVECLACHGRQAANFNASKGISRVAAEIQGSSEAHRSFYYSSVSDKEVGDINQTSLTDAGINTGPQWYNTTNYANQSVIKLKGTNTACIGCHTHAIVNISWTRSVGYNMTVVAETSGSNAGALNITSWGINDTTQTNYTSGE